MKKQGVKKTTIGSYCPQLFDKSEKTALLKNEKTHII